MKDRKLSGITKRFLALTTNSTLEELNNLYFINVLREACEFLEKTDLKNLPKYVNHPVIKLRMIIKQRLAKGT